MATAYFLTFYDAAGNADHAWQLLPKTVDYDQNRTYPTDQLKNQQTPVKWFRKPQLPVILGCIKETFI